MSGRLIYEDIDKRIFVVTEATEETPQVERIEWLRPTPEQQIEALADALGQTTALLMGVLMGGGE